MFFYASAIQKIMDPIAKCNPRNNGSPPLRFEDDRLQDDCTDIKYSDDSFVKVP